MKNNIKTAITAILAVALIAGIQVTAFAATSASEADDTQNEIVVGQQDNDDAGDDDDADQTADATSGDIVASPNTGVAAAPFVAALLAAASVPVMVATRKRK